MSSFRIRLVAGPLTAEFDPATGWLRRVRLHGVEVVRAVYPAVRDEHWNTLPNRLSNLEVGERPGGCLATFIATCGAVYGFRGAIEGSRDGTLVYRFEGQAREDFLRNRIGLCVLHPVVERGGAPCEIERSNGTIESSAFPATIAAHQPFLDVRALRFAGVETRFEGDEFETEDQRNWTDASFKTYSTPLRHRWPVAVAAGERVAQSVTLRLIDGARLAISPPSQLTTQATPTENVRTGGTLRIGLGACDRPLTTEELQLLQPLNPAHLRVDLVPGRVDVAARLRIASEQARSLGTTLEVCLLCDDDPVPGLNSLAEIVAAERPIVGSWLIARSRRGVGCPQALVLARRLLPAARFGIGTNYYFAELNREPPDATDADFVFFSVNPQVHAFDDESLLETIDGQRWVVEATRRLTGKPVAVTPVTLRPRFNPHAVAAGEPIDPDGAYDPRLDTAFAADWTLGSARALAAAGAESVTYFQTAGPCGLVLENAARPICKALAKLFSGESVDG